MLIKTIIDTLDTYDFLKANCEKDATFLGRWDLKTWLSGMVHSGSCYVIKPKKRIQVVCFGYPVEDLAKDSEMPQFNKEGHTFFSPFSHVSEQYKGNWMEDIAKEALMVYNDIERFAFWVPETGEGGKVERKPKLFQVNAEALIQ